MAAMLAPPTAQQPTPTAPTPADATWGVSTLVVITVLVLVAALAIVRMARVRLLPTETKRAKPTSGRRSSAWVEAGKRMQAEPASEDEGPDEPDPEQEPHG